MAEKTGQNPTKVLATLKSNENLRQNATSRIVERKLRELLVSKATLLAPGEAGKSDEKAAARDEGSEEAPASKKASSEKQADAGEAASSKKATAKKKASSKETAEAPSAD